MASPTTEMRNFAVDVPLVQSAPYRLDAKDRAYIDDQIRTMQQYMVQALINGVIGTYIRVDSSSAPVAVGDVLCSANSPLGILTVTRAVAAAIATAGAVFGVALTAASPGGYVFVAVEAILTPSQSKLTTSGPVRLNPVTGTLQVVSSFALTDYIIGNSNAGWVTIVRGLAVNIGGTSTAFTFASLGGLIADLNADLLVGTTGTAIATWPDSTPSGNNLVQATGAKQPTIVAPAVYGKKALRYDGVTQSMRCPTFIVNSREMTIYMVMALRVEGSGGFVMEYNVSDCALNHAGATGFPQILREVGSAGYIVDVAGAGFAIRSAQFRDDNTNEFFYQGVSRATFTNSHLIPPSGPFEIGAHANSGGLFAPIDVARILVYNCKHTAAQGKAVYNQLATEYGFALLP